MGERIEQGDLQVFIGDKPLAIGMLAEPAKFDEDFGSIPDDWKNEKELSFQHSVSFDVTKSEELMKLQEELIDSFSRRYSEWVKRVDVAAMKILTEYIDNPFKTNPFTATKEEFEKRHINAVVFQDMKDGVPSFIGVLQGTTLICVDGKRIENFKRA